MMKYIKLFTIVNYNESFINYNESFINYNESFINYNYLLHMY